MRFPISETSPIRFPGPIPTARALKLAEDPWFAKYGYRVLEMPTGQGLLIK